MQCTLIVANNALRKSNANGSLLISLLPSFPIEEVLTFSIDGAMPDKDVGITHFKTTGKKHNLGMVVHNDELTVFSSGPSAVGKHKGIKESALGLSIREFIWKHGRWDKTNLYNFIDEYKPDVILFQCSRTIFMVNLVAELSKRFNIPIAIYTGEDEYFHKYHWYRFIKNNLQRKMKKAYKKVFLYVKKAMFTQPKLEQLYKNEFGVDTLTIMPPCSIEPVNNPIINKQGPVMYIGNVQPNRVSSLLEVSRLLDNIDKNIEFHIYSGDITSKVRKQLSRCPNIVIKNPVPKSEVANLMKQARLLIHVESFRKKDKVLIENGFSTKIPDSLASGVPFILYGPSYCGFSSYFINQGGVVRYLDNKEALESTLRKIFNDDSYAYNLAIEGIEIAKKNHNKNVNSKKIYDILTSISKE